MVKGKLFKVRYQSLAHTWAPLLGSEQLAHASFPVGSQGEPASFRDDHCREPAALAVHPSVPSEHSWPRLVPCWVPPSRVSRNVLQHWSCWLHQRPCEHSQTWSWDTGSKQQNEDFHNTTPHHKSPHRIASHRIASHHITSHHCTSHHITSHHCTSRQHHVNIKPYRQRDRNKIANSLSSVLLYQHNCIQSVTYLPHTGQSPQVASLGSCRWGLEVLVWRWSVGLSSWRLNGKIDCVACLTYRRPAGW